MTTWKDENGKEIHLVPGDSVAIRDGKEYVNGEEVEAGTLAPVLGISVWEELKKQSTGDGLHLGNSDQGMGIYKVTVIKKENT